MWCFGEARSMANASLGGLEEGSRWAGAETRRVGLQFNGPGTYSAKWCLSRSLALSNLPAITLARASNPLFSGPDSVNVIHGARIPYSVFSMPCSDGFQTCRPSSLGFFYLLFFIWRPSRREMTRGTSTMICGGVRCHFGPKGIIGGACLSPLCR